MSLLKRRRPLNTGNPPPVGAAAKVRLRYYAVFERSLVRNRWLLVALVVASAIIAIQASSIRFMLPLERIVPYFLAPNSAVPGRVDHTEITATQFTPSQMQVRFALEAWVGQIWTIDPSLTRKNLAQAATLTVGASARELPQLVKEEKVFARMTESPELRRDVAVLSTDFLADGVAIVRIALTERENGVSKPPTFKSMVIHHAVTPPATWKDVQRSVVGLTITDFNWSDAHAIDPNNRAGG